MTTRLRPLLLVGLLALQALTVVGVVIVTGRSTADLLIDGMRETMALAVTSLDRRTADHLVPAESAAVHTAELLQAGVLPVSGDDDALLRYLDAQLAATPSITGAYVARPDGSFVLVSRDGATQHGGTRVKTVEVGAEGSRSTTVQRDAEGVEVSAAEDPDDTYDPRTRPWYEAASATDNVVWTDPYIFFASREPGVTTAAAARGADGELLAVVGVDLSLRDLSAFVGEVQVSPASRAILFDEDEVMVASGDLSQVMVEDGPDALRRADVAELTDPVLLEGIAAIRAETGGEPITGVTVTSFEVNGEAWQMALAPLGKREPWLAAVAAPESEFVTDVVDAQRRNALLAVGVSLGVVVLALPALAWITRRFDRMAADASTDVLTGLPNRRRFEDLLAEHLEASSTEAPICVAAIDVDLFKRINDTWGHGVGDEALVAIAGRLRAAVRDDDVVARVGGDEFAAILVDTPVAVALEVLERARRAVGDAPANTVKGPVTISVTIGVSEAAGAASGPREAVLERTDTALYAAKDAGRNRVASPAGVFAADATPA